MRHLINKRTLNRKRDQRRALLKSLSVNFILKEKMKTTEAKAKTVKPVIERLITRAKENNLNNYRRINSYLQSREATKKLLEKIGPKYKERAGGYCRIIKIGPRRGDAAPMVILELV